MYTDNSSDDPDQRTATTEVPERPPPTHVIVAAGAARAANDTGEPDDDRLFTGPFLRLLGMQAAYGFSFSLFYLLPKYLAASGATPTQIGFVMGGFGVACVLTIPFLHGIVELFGRRGALMAATLALAVAGAIFALIAPVGLAAVFLRASEGVTWTIMFSIGLLLTAEMAPRHRLAQAIGLAGGAALIMNAVAPAIGEPIADRFGYRPVFLLAAISALVAAAMARRLPAGRAAAVDRSGTAPTRTPTRLGSEAAPVRRLRIYLVFGISGLAFSSLFTFLAPFALAHGVRAIRTFFISYTVAALAVRVLGGRLADQIGHRSIAMIALVKYGLVVASTGLFGPHHLVPLGIFFGLAHGAVFPAMMALLINSTPPSSRPRVLGIANGAMSLGISAVFPAGMLVARLGYPAMFAIVGSLVAAGAVLLRRPRE
jgi:predicted MFS family arabinose efflux permease